MITYDSRNWFAALALHRADTFRKLLPLLIAVGSFTWAIGHIETAVLGFTPASCSSRSTDGLAYPSRTDGASRTTRARPC